MDYVDRTLLLELQTNSRQTNRALAESAGLAPSTTLARVRELEAKEIITGYHAEVDLAAIGRGLQALVFVRLQPKSQEIIESFIDHVWSLPETIGVHLISGAEDAIIHVAVSDTEALQNVVVNQISSHTGVFAERTSLLFGHRRRQVIEPF